MKNKKLNEKKLKKISEDKKFVEYLRREGASERERLLGDILNVVKTEDLEIINNYLDLKIQDPDKELIKKLELMGLVKIENNISNNQGIDNYTKIIFTDSSNVAQFFPGYLRNKEYWEEKKTK